jgi:NTP pyrophosphatase (non-canonical NTP hydrolase)
MKVTIENYTECCLRTWNGHNQKERAELGIIGEMGEVAEVLKKFLRGDFDEVERDRRLLKELGDLLYYIAIDCYLYDMVFHDQFYMVDNIIRNFDNMRDNVFEYTSGSIADGYDLIKSFNSFCLKHNFTIEQIMQANIDKLTERAEKNLISGDGSDR